VTSRPFWFGFVTFFLVAIIATPLNGVIRFGRPHIRLPHIHYRSGYRTTAQLGQFCSHDFDGDVTVVAVIPDGAATYETKKYFSEIGQTVPQRAKTP
jgi:hypothetical protein